MKASMLGVFWFMMCKISRNRNDAKITVLARSVVASAAHPGEMFEMCTSESLKLNLLRMNHIRLIEIVNLARISVFFKLFFIFSIKQIKIL